MLAAFVLLSWLDTDSGYGGFQCFLGYGELNKGFSPNLQVQQP